MTKRKPIEFTRLPAVMSEIKLTNEQYQKARDLGEGAVLCAYLDGRAIRMETEEGEDPFVWAVW